ncbi:hypothetical protein [Roseateles chitinivorans]|uniref:hypothetical protein n=1 Tax=Roseateles chitinivorans TaxID=2917965 RepID=UPI003D66D131
MARLDTARNQLSSDLPQGVKQVAWTEAVQEQTWLESETDSGSDSDDDSARDRVAVSYGDALDASLVVPPVPEPTDAIVQRSKEASRVGGAGRGSRTAMEIMIAAWFDRRWEESGRMARLVMQVPTTERITELLLRRGLVPDRTLLDWCVVQCIDLSAIAVLSLDRYLRSMSSAQRLEKPWTGQDTVGLLTELLSHGSQPLADGSVARLLFATFEASRGATPVHQCRHVEERP